MMGGVCILFLLGTIPYILSGPDPLETVNINLNLGEGTNTGYADEQGAIGSDYQDQDDLHCYLENSIWRFGIVIGKNIQPTARDCSLSCCRTFRCIYWTYHRSSKKCSLSGYIKRTDFISGRKNCPIPSSVAETGRHVRNYGRQWLIEECVGLSARGYCYMDNAIWGDRITFDVIRGDKNTFEVNTEPTAQDCQKSCSNKRPCFNWTFMKSTNRCFLRRAASSSVGFISGEKNCAPDL